MKRIATVIVFCFYIFILPICAQNSCGADTIYFEIQGLILSKKGTEINVIMNEPTTKMPALNTVGEFSKSFEKEFAGSKITGWLTIGIVKIAGFKNQVLRFILIEEKSEITVDGVKQDHFVTGQTVKFTWKELIGPDEILFDRGIKEYDNKNKQAAMNYFKQVAAINPKHAEALNMIGILYHENSVYDSAALYYKKAWIYDTANIVYIKNIAITNTNLNKYPEAYKFAAKAVFHAPDDAEAHYLRAITYLYTIIYSLNGEMTAADKKQILSDMDFAVSVNEKDSFYYKERMIIRSFFQDYSGACEDAKKYRALEGSAGDKFIIEYCN